MHLDSLFVYHLKKGVLPPAEIEQKAFYLETCQRKLWISDCPLFMPSEVESYRGREAYFFLLKVASGLESAVVGETDIFGQLKEAWRVFENQKTSKLKHWMQRLFEDTKEMRRLYLESLGGYSYGSLVRKWLNQSGEIRQILLVGVGQIAQSIAPYLEGMPVSVANRSSEKLNEFCQELLQKKVFATRVAQDLEKEAWKSASHVILCIPFDSEKDPARQSWFLEGAQDRPLLHLGGIRSEAGTWGNLPSFFSLSELFKMQESHGSLRSLKIHQAHKACRERAQLRALGNSLSISHGWEDLVSFL